MSEERSYQFAMQPSLRPPFQAESDEHATVAWNQQPDGRTVRVVVWTQRPKKKKRRIESPWYEGSFLEVRA